MRRSLIFTLKVWFTTIVVGSILVIASFILNSPSDSTEWKFIPTFLLFTMLYSMMWSLPTLFAFYFACYGLSYFNVRTSLLNASLVTIAIGGCMLTLPFLIHNKSILDTSSLVFVACYAAPLLISTIIYNSPHPDSLTMVVPRR